jgi:DNA-binding IclR family transcriptional regulator
MKIGSIEKCVKIIEHLSQNPRGLKLSEISNFMGNSGSAIHHILNTLLPYDYIYQDPTTKKYFLGTKFLSLSKGIMENFSIRDIASESMQTLRKKSKLGDIRLFILRNKSVICISQLDALEGVSLSLGIGFTILPHACASGKVLISELSAADIKSLYPNKKLLNPNLAKNTIKDRDKLLKELANIRIQGYAVDNEESLDGVRCVAAPIRAGSNIIAALSISGLSAIITMERINLELKRLVIESADEISGQMKW